MINKKRKAKNIENYWKMAGKKRCSMAANKSTPTSRDPFLSRLERENIIKYLKGDYTVLELGCGDGIHTVEYAKYVKKIYAIDFVDGLIKKAKKRADIRKRSNISFYCSSAQDVDKLLSDKPKFDIVISQRCLINLASWEKQARLIEKIAGLLRKGGLLLLAEGFMRELMNLNFLREEVGLKKIQVVDYNLFFGNVKFEAKIRRFFEVVEKERFGTYMFLSRVVYPMSVFPRDPKHGSKFNQVAYQIMRKKPIPELDKFGYDVFYALKRK